MTTSFVLAMFVLPIAIIGMAVVLAMWLRKQDRKEGSR
jgi:hypothetical protein